MKYKIKTIRDLIDYIGLKRGKVLSFAEKHQIITDLTLWGKM